MIQVVRKRTILVYGGHYVFASYKWDILVFKNNLWYNLVFLLIIKWLFQTGSFAHQPGGAQTQQGCI